MNRLLLFTGAAAMVVCGFIFKSESQVAVGLGLMWIGFSATPPNQPAEGE